MNTARRLAMVALMLALAASFSACGRKGPPEVPPGSTYPQQYPQY